MVACFVPLCARCCRVGYERCTPRSTVAGWVGCLKFGHILFFPSSYHFLTLLSLLVSQIFSWPKFFTGGWEPGGELVIMFVSILNVPCV